jgi:branched-chain amino acid transport system substrate-binding protein
MKPCETVAAAVRFLTPAVAILVAANLGGTSLCRAAGCSITVGVVMELTGTAGAYGQAAEKSVEMAFRDLNDAGGVRGCRLVTDTHDSESQATVAVDAANQLVRLRHVPVVIGAIISSTTIPILTAVTAPAHVVQMSPAASSPKLTALGLEGRTNGMFFRTITSDALQGRVAARYALERGLKRLAVIYVNNDFGLGLYQEFARAYQAGGGVVTAAVRYNERQSSYGSEVTAAIGTPADGLYLISTPGDGATLARTWISQGGSRRFLLNDGMNSADFIAGVGAKYLSEAYGTSSGTNPTASTRYFYDQYPAYSKMDAGSPAADRAYDAAAIVGLAIAAAGGSAAGGSTAAAGGSAAGGSTAAAGSAADAPQPAAIRTAIYRVTDPKGAVIHAGREEFARGLALIKEGKPVRYEGVIGPVSFDSNGDISGPFRLWRIVGGQVTTIGEMSGDGAAVSASERAATSTTGRGASR